MLSFSTAASVASPESEDDEQEQRQQPKQNKNHPPTKKPKAKTTTSSKRRSLLQHADSMKDPIIVTSRAAERIRDLLQGENAKGAIGIRLGVRRRGCSGLSYTLNYTFDDPDLSKKEESGKSKKNTAASTASIKDVQMEAHGIKVFIEPMALFTIVGTTMDWEETELTSEFTFKNPNSKGECGCEESFTV